MNKIKNFIISSKKFYKTLEKNIHDSSATTPIDLTLVPEAIS